MWNPFGQQQQQSKQILSTVKCIEPVFECVTSLKQSQKELYFA